MTDSGVTGGPALVFFFGGACLEEEGLEAAGRDVGGVTKGRQAINVKGVGTGWITGGRDIGKDGDYVKEEARGFKLARRWCVVIVAVLRASERDVTEDTDVAMCEVVVVMGGFRGPALDFLGGGFAVVGA